jgi:hypothetical protein
VVYFKGNKEEKRKTTIQMTVNVERAGVKYSSEANIQDKVETLIKYYGKR